MTATRTCHKCGKARTGRLVRQEGDRIPYYYCRLCVPEGTGKGEAPAMPDVPGAVKGKVTSLQAAGQSLLAPLQVLTPLDLQTEEDYQEADRRLSVIRRARAEWRDRLQRVVKPIREGLDELYALGRDVDKPMEAMEGAYREGMQAYKMRELQAIREAERKKQEEEAQAVREAEEAMRKAEAARTAQLREKLQKQAMKAIERVDEITYRVDPTPVRAASSTTRVIKTPIVVDLNAFLSGIIVGEIPADLVAVQGRVLSAAYKEDPQSVLSWPGVEIQEEIQVVGR